MYPPELPTSPSFSFTSHEINEDRPPPFLHLNTLMPLVIRDGHSFVELSFLKTNEIFRGKGCCSEKNERKSNEMDRSEK